MTIQDSIRGATPDRLAHLLLMREIEDFLYREADLLDEREFNEWLELFTDDIRYWMPLRKNLPFKERHRDISGDDEVAWFDDNRKTLQSRVNQIMTGVHWAEEPLSRVSHLISNIRIEGDYEDVEGAEILVKSHFLVHRNRMETETAFLAGRRHDTLRRIGSSFKICRRKIIIDQTTLTVKNLSFFF